MNHRLFLSLLLSVMYCALARAQYNPDNPTEPYSQCRLTLVETPDGSGTFNMGKISMQNVGESVVLRATATNGFVFESWTEGDSIVSTTASFNYKMPNHDVTLTAHFTYGPNNPDEPDEPIVFHTLLLNASPADGGSVSPSGNRYSRGQQVAVTARNDNNFTFINWTEDGVEISTSASFTYTMPDRNTTLTANFEFAPDNPDEPLEPHLLRHVYLISNPTSAGYFNTDSGNRFTEGTTQTFTAYGNTGFAFKNWSIGDSIVSTNRSYSLTIPDYDITLQANFHEYNPDAPSEPDPADGHAAFYGQTETVLCGETAMYPVYLEKTALSQHGFTMIAKGYMFDIAFPEGFDVNKEGIILYHINDQTYNIEELNDTTFRIIVLGNESLVSDNGIAMEIPVKIPDDAEKGRTYPVSLSHGVLIHPDESSTVVPVRSGGLYINGIVPPRIYPRKGLVNIVSEQRGAVMHYTTDGTEPTLASTTYTEPFYAEEGTVVKAVSVYSSFISDITTYIVTKSGAELPEIEFNDPLLTMSCDSEDAIIHYTLDGSTPTASSSVYSKPITITEPCIVKAYATGNESMADSDIEEYEIRKCDDVIFEFRERQLTLSCHSEESSIYYTLDGTIPDDSSSKYEGPIVIGNSCIVKAIAFKKGMLRSEVGEYEVIGGRLNAPQFEYDGDNILRILYDSIESDIYYYIEGLSVSFIRYEKPLVLTDNRPIYAYAAAAGYENSDTVCFTPTNFRVAPVEISFSEPWLSMACQTDGATIHYSHNSEEAVYSSPIEINQPCEVYVWAEKPYFNNSDTVSYNIIRCAEPVISYADGRVSISCTNKGAKIFYTLDNSEPDSTALSYTEPFAVNNNTEIRAVAYLDGALHSHIANYNINTFKLSAPTFEYDEPWLSIKSTSDGATIHYILNGEEDIYDEPLKITEPCDIYAWATKENFNNSDTVFYHVDVAAREFFFDGLLFRIISFEDNSCEVIANGADGYTGDIRIPEMAVRYGEPWLVTAIAEGAFADCMKVTSIIIPDNIRSIGAKSLETGNLNALVYCSSHILPLVPEGTRNIIVDGITERITLQEGYDFSCPEPFTAEKISYDREFRQHTGLGYSEGWETLTLPFDVQTVYHRDKQTEIRPIISGEASALPGFWLRAFTADGFMPAGEIRANTPYIISMPNNEEYVEAARLPGRVSFRAVNATVPVSTKESSFAGGRMFVPTTTAVPQSESVFVLNSGESFEGHPSGSVFVSALRGVRPFEAYLSAENSARILSIGELLGDASGIQDVTADGEGRLTICNLNGVPLKRISAAQLPEAMSTLPKGVYIINNKKVLVK